jgi:toxin ParE1/3/4
MQVRLTERAERDLKDIFAFSLGAFGRAQAESYLGEFDSVFRLIAQFPSIGPIYEGNSRAFVHRKHIVFYRIRGELVVIGRVVHGSRSRTPTRTP